MTEVIISGAGSLRLIAADLRALGVEYRILGRTMFDRTAASVAAMLRRRRSVIGQGINQP